MMDHTSDPAAARHVIDPSRLDLAREFRACIRGPHSEDLRKVLHRMRWGDFPGRYVLAILEPGRHWMLAQMPEARGQKVRLFPDVQFDSLEEAEWHVFCLRWKALTGQELHLDARHPQGTDAA